MYNEALEFIIKPTSTVPYSPDPTSFPTIVPDLPIIERIGGAGHRTLWVVFVLMVIATIGFVVLSWTVPASKRLYHSITTLVVVISALSYYAMATGTGVTWHHKVLRVPHGDKLPDTHRHLHRQIFFAHFIDWALTTPLLIFDLSLLAGLSGASIFSAVTSSLVFVLTGLFAALGHRKGQVWGWYTISVIAYLWVVYTLVFTGRSAARTKNATVSKFYNSIALFSIIVWTAYPVIWGIVDGSRILSVNGETIAYAVLDVLAKGVFGAWLLITHRRTPETHVDVGGFWAHGATSEGHIRIGDDEGA